MKLLVLSDLQGIDHREWIQFIQMDAAAYDATLLLGDIEDLFLKTIAERFSQKPLWGVLGNHDYVGDLEWFNIPNAHGKIVNVGSLRIVGLQGSIRYKAGDAPMLSQMEASLYCRNLPPADLMMSHNSPKGVHDKPDVAHEGFEGLLNYIKEHQPRYALHGHQHKNEVDMIGKTQIIGVCGGILLDMDTGERNQVLHVSE
jgi:Icc-related predicted phosphoesterase